MSPHTYEPTPADVASFASADMWFTLGEGFLPLEDQVAAALPDLPRAATGAEVKEVAEAGGEEGEMDPHIWLSARNGILMTNAVRDEMTAQYPEFAERFSDRAAAYGCPVELITHGHVPHRVLANHDTGEDTKGGQ